MSNRIPEPPRAESPSTSAPIAVHKLDFVSLGLPEYKDAFVLVIDNLFTPEDCKKLLAAAESSKEWERAAVNGPPGSGEGVVVPSYRNSSRILYDDPELAGWIFEKLLPHLKEIETEEGEHHLLFSNPRAKYISGQKRIQKLGDSEVRILRVNERLRFLKYGVGEFFKRHCDGIYYTPDQKEISYYTLQIYLNGDKETLEGGATRIWSKKARLDRKQKKDEEGYGSWVDVEARTGRVLIFEQKDGDHGGIAHSGEMVTRGEKISVRSDIMYA
ncbi:hypothetical protein FRC02_009268 [Tulasnella sp. 418]|nr:hypothetical protein FRC02_009268 [Tulasnella sp. 418]